MTRLVFRKSGSLVLQKFGPPETLKNLNGLCLILIIVGSVQVSVQIEEEKQENEVLSILTPDKDVSIAMESEPGKEYIEMEEIGKIDNSGTYCLTKVNIYESCGKLSLIKVRYSQNKNVVS